MRIDEEVDKLRQANHDLREGLRQAIKAIESQQEHIKALEELITSQQEHIKTLEGQLAKDSHNSSLPVRPYSSFCLVPKGTGGSLHGQRAYRRWKRQKGPEHARKASYLEVSVQIVMRGQGMAWSKLESRSSNRKLADKL